MTDFTERLYSFPANSPLQILENPFPEPVNIRLFLKRDDMIHPLVSGNKWRKLKYNLLAAHERGLDTLLTFGGAYSNHLYATAAAGREFGFRTIGVVRGQELADKALNDTLTFCRECGMHLHFVSRDEYRRKDDPDFLADLMQQLGPCYVVPEGGMNALAIRGTAEIIPELINQLGNAPDYVCCPVGTGGTWAGLVQSAPVHTTVLGFVSLKIPDDKRANVASQIYDYHFGGYGKTTPELLRFIQTFEQQNPDVSLEQVYTGKMLYGIRDLALKGFFKSESTVVAVHTGGLQGRSRELDFL
ncbi:1-aminocyclopropane-1-carboxylate deaminase/D-cysteine desulfhydrase [Spirosoma sp.]|uniref:1-aminocyclopropane-1-carboxylate deaminase/D-cysteine desulfhydrase n=1 Tax=Spirosoma sp. TaxID=1899569 RepID=UPI003B3B5254